MPYIHQNNKNLTKVTFICCVFNEIKIAPANLTKLIAALSKVNFLYEIILIDNASSDGTSEWIKLVKYKNIKKIFNSHNIGKGGSIKKGIIHAKGDIAVIFDLDGEYLVEDAIYGIEFLNKSNATVSLASRTLGQRKIFLYALNFYGVMAINFFINILYKKRLTDTATGLKIINTEFFKHNKLLFNGFNVDFEIVCLALSNNLIVNEYCGSYFPRSKKQGKKINAFRDGISSLFVIFVTFFRHLAKD
jgi:dolichol-phosphate mannosyltransferase